MSRTRSQLDPLIALAEEFADRYRRGERPSLMEYTERHPELAERIRRLFPTMLVIEEFGSIADDGAAAGSGWNRVPARLGEYRILREVARGGMGIVYEAVQESLGRHVALKVLPAGGYSSPTRLERFRREARAAARLHHTNIVPVFGVGEDNGVHYYGMQFIRGQSLENVLNELRRIRDAAQEARNLPGVGSAPEASPRSIGREVNSAVAEQRESTIVDLQVCGELSGPTHEQYYRRVAQIGVQVAEALAYAHQQGVLHRDIKPSNLLLDEQGTVWITDFGLAKADGTDELTAQGDIVGTLRYMAPERFRGDADQRSDVYSLGVTLREMLTLERVFEESDRARLIAQLQNADPPSPRKVDPHIPLDLETIVLKAAARDPDERYATAAAFAEDLRRFLADRPIEARRAAWAERAWRWCRRNRTIAAWASAFLLLLLISSVVGGVLSLRLWTALDQSERDRNEALEAEREKTEKLWTSYLERARAGRYSRQAGQRQGSLEALAAAAKIRPDQRLRDEAIAALALPDLRRGPKYILPAQRKANVAFDASYRWYAVADAAGTIEVCGLLEAAAKRHIETKQDTQYLAFAPNGQFVAQFDEEDVLRVWRVGDGVPVLAEPPANCQCLAFSPDGRNLAVAAARQIICYDLETGGESTRWALPAAAHTLAFHPRGWQIAAGFEQSADVEIYTVADGRKAATLPTSSIMMQVVAWDPDGERLAVAGVDPKIEIWHVAARQRLATLIGHSQNVTRLAFHPEGELLASSSWDGTLRLWHAATGRALMQLPATMLAVQFSSDHRWLGVVWPGGAEAQLLEIVPSREYRTFVSRLGADRGQFYEGDLCPDSRFLALAMDDGIRLWELSTGKEVAFLPLRQMMVVRYQPGGRELVAAGAGGLYRCAVEVGAADELRLGPARRIALPFTPVRFAQSADGGRLAVCSEVDGAAAVVDLASESVVGAVVDHPRAGNIAIGPDGSWLATSGWHTDRVRLWSATDGQMLHEWPGHAASFVFAMPDSRSLLESQGDGFSLWDVHSRELNRRVPREVAVYASYVGLARDGRTMAMEMAPGIIHVCDVSTGSTLAIFEDPSKDRSSWLGLTADGSKLVAVSAQAHAIHVWDLQAIQRQLRSLGLDEWGQERRVD